MKQLLLTACLPILLLVASCKKEDESGVVQPPPDNPVNFPPIARAGADTTIQLIGCQNKKASIELDGSLSTDADNNIDSYQWLSLSGPSGFIMRSPVTSKCRVDSLLPGAYAFVLVVRDKRSLSTSDTILVTVKGGSGVPEAYDLDLPLTALYTTVDNEQNHWEDDLYYDLFNIQVSTTINTVGILNASIQEYSDSAALSNTILYSSLFLHTFYTGAPFNLHIVGELRGVHFKKLIREGGGTFTGQFVPMSGSVDLCNKDIIPAMAPLLVTGTLTVSTRTISFHIKGTVYF